MPRKKSRTTTDGFTYWRDECVRRTTLVRDARRTLKDALFADAGDARIAELCDDFVMHHKAAERALEERTYAKRLVERTGEAQT